VLWKTLELNFAFAKKKIAWYLYEKKMTDNKYNLYQIYEFKIIVYDMKLKWVI